MSGRGKYSGQLFIPYTILDLMTTLLIVIDYFG